MKSNTRLTLWAIVTVGFLVTIGCDKASKVSVTAGGGQVDRDLSRVSEVRRLLRSACGKLRTAVADATQSEVLLTAAADETDGALTLWREFIREHADMSPAAYTAHENWDRDAYDIEQGILKMLEETTAKRPTEAFQTCGHTCGKFVEMNEKAGIRRTSDVLFQFRKVAKPLAEPAKAGTLVPLSEALPRLLKLRDDALTDPVGGTGTLEQKRLALVSFSADVDAFAKAVRNDGTGQVADLYDTMMKAMEQAYDLFL